MSMTTRLPIRFDALYALLSSAFFISPSDSYVEIAGEDVSARMGWAFRASFARLSIAGAHATDKTFRVTRGVHGWGGRWLVNGAGDRIVRIDLAPPQRARVLGFPVNLRQLLIHCVSPGQSCRQTITPPKMVMNMIHSGRLRRTSLGARGRVILGTWYQVTRSLLLKISCFVASAQ